MSDIKVESTSSESPSTKREVSPKAEKPEIKEIQKEGSLSLKMKIILFGSIGLTLILIAGIVFIVLLRSKSENEYKMEISDLKTEKEVLENQNSKMRNEIQNLTKSNTVLSKKLNEQSVQVIKDEQKKNETYKTLEVISKEGDSLKTTFAKITNNIEKINDVKKNKYQQEKIQEQTQGQTQEQDPNRELEEGINTLQNQLELIQALMAQISLNLDLINQNKELLSTNIELSRQLNHQIINNTLLISENQNLIREKIDLNNKLQTQTELNEMQELKIKQLENELSEEKERFKKTCFASYTNEEDKKKIEELNKKINEEIDKNILLKNEISNLENAVEKKNISLQICLNEQEEFKEDIESLNSNIQNLYVNINNLNSNNTNLSNENLVLKSENLKFNEINNNLNKSLDICNKENINLKEENENLQIDVQNLSHDLNQTKINLTFLQNQIEISEIDANTLSSELNKCKINATNLANENKNYLGLYNSLNQQYYKCNINLNDFISKYNNLSTENFDLKAQVNNLIAENNQCIKNYSLCSNQLEYYSKLPSEIQKQKEEISQLNTTKNNCLINLDKCYSGYPHIEYNGINDNMRMTILELITYAYRHCSDNYNRASYVKNRMNEYYNKAKWSCFVARLSVGVDVHYINNLYYSYTYGSLKWIVFVGNNK